MQTTIIRSRRRSLCVQIHSEKGVIIRAPRYLSDRRIAKFLQEKQDWIKKTQTKVAKAQSNKPTYSFIPGENFPLLGKLTTPPVHTRPKLIEWYKLKALPHLTKRTKIIAKELETKTGKRVAPREIRIRTYRSRWGTCSAKNAITYNWKIIMAPPKIIDYLVAHELSHILHKNHGPKFKKTLSIIDPDYKANQKWLRENGSTLSI